jgi:DNA-binding transcriptional regulator YhcF (GntR family)
MFVGFPDLQVDRRSATPVSGQLVSLLESAITREELTPGTQLPSLRDAATATGVNVNTVRAVYAKLEAAGLVVTEQGRGTFVAATAPAEQRSRRKLLDDIARFEAELASVPLQLQHSEPGRKAGRPRARMLSLEELEAVRDLLAQRLSELHAARGAIVERLESGALVEPSALLEPATAPERHPVRAPSRRSSSSLAGARIRWTGA